MNRAILIRTMATLGFAGSLVFGGLIACRSGDHFGDLTHSRSGTVQDVSLQSLPQSPQNQGVVLEPNLKVTRPWRIVFVSKDGPKGHQTYHPGDCDISAWCEIWQGAQQAGEQAGAVMELDYVQNNCSSDYECVTAQIQLIDQLISRNDIDGMIIGPRESNLLVPVVEKAIATDIPVLTIDTPLNTKQVVTQILPDDYQMGAIVAQWVVAQLKEEGNILLLHGPDTQANASSRKNGILPGLQKGHIHILDTEATQWTQQEARTVTQQWLTEFSNIDAILTVGGNLALGAAQEVKTHQRDDILVTSFDASPQIRQALRSGDISATVDQRLSLQGQLGTQLLLKKLESGESWPNIVSVPDIRLLTMEDIAVSSP